LNISYNAITANGLVDITWLLRSTQLQNFEFGDNRFVLARPTFTQHFVAVGLWPPKLGGNCALETVDSLMLVFVSSPTP
jgi:hypothetical protein